MIKIIKKRLGSELIQCDSIQATMMEYVEANDSRISDE